MLVKYKLVLSIIQYVSLIYINSIHIVFIIIIDSDLHYYFLIYPDVLELPTSYGEMLETQAHPAPTVQQQTLSGSVWQKAAHVRKSTAFPVARHC